MKKLRLLVTKYCPKSCAGCCNKDWDLDNLPVVDDFGIYDEIFITGGEPLAVGERDITLKIVEFLHIFNPNARVIIYTANPSGILWLNSMYAVDGYTLTIHNEDDIDALYDLNNVFLSNEEYYREFFSLRLNVFKGITLPEELDLRCWTVKKDIEWIPNCPLPEDEVFMRMPNI